MSKSIYYYEKQIQKLEKEKTEWMYWAAHNEDIANERQTEIENLKEYVHVLELIAIEYGYEYGYTLKDMLNIYSGDEDV